MKAAPRCDSCLLGECRQGTRPSRCQDRLNCGCCAVVVSVRASSPPRPGRKQVTRRVPDELRQRRHYRKVTDELLAQAEAARRTGLSWRAVAEKIGYDDHAYLRRKLIAQGYEDPPDRKPVNQTCPTCRRPWRGPAVAEGSAA